MSIDQEYKDFSKWCRDNPAYDLDPRLHTHSGRINDGGYILHKRTGTAFKAWQASRQALEGEPVAWWDGDTSAAEDSFSFKPNRCYTIPLYTHPASAAPDEEYLRALQDAFDIIQADANTKQNYGSLCRIGSVLAKLKAAPTKASECQECDGSGNMKNLMVGVLPYPNCAAEKPAGNPGPRLPRCESCGNPLPFHATGCFEQEQDQ